MPREVKLDLQVYPRRNIGSPIVKRHPKQPALGRSMSTKYLLSAEWQLNGNARCRLRPADLAGCGQREAPTVPRHEKLYTLSFGHS